jgi:GNAT superfamily N-acetyltransferase
MQPAYHEMIRQALPADAESLAKLGESTFRETFAADNSPENMDAYVAASFSASLQAAELTDPDSLILLFELVTPEVSVPIGYAKLKSGEPPSGVAGENPIELVRLYVMQGWIGHRVGARLMETCLAEAKRAGHRTIWLGVWEHNQRARSFYRKWNFREVGTHIFQLGTDAQTDILMERSLDQEDDAASRI